MYGLIKQRFKKKYNSGGNPAYSFIKMVKVLLLQSLYNLSDRKMDEALFDRISFQKFAGFFFKGSVAKIKSKQKPHL